MYSMGPDSSAYDGVRRVSGLRREPAVSKICVRSSTETAGSLRNLETQRTPSYAEKVLDNLESYKFNFFFCRNRN